MVICNKCGKQLLEENGVMKEDFLCVKKEWGYFSRMDGKIWEFNICEDCMYELEKELKIPIRKRDKTELL